MKVLMFGWEYPPHISGGLGTACHGLAKGLATFNDIDLTFIVPKVFGDEDKQGLKLIGASEVEVSDEIIAKQRDWEKKKFYEFNQSISAYTTPVQYEEIISKLNEKKLTPSENVLTGKMEFSGQYGNSLFEEISRYGVIASELAKKEHYDVIHAHDWLTYPAGIEAKKVSGKPLVVHVHATEYDRCGVEHNEQVFEIEQKGMAIADKVITVSDFTRNIVIEKYKINPSKVVTVHNAVKPAIGGNIKYLWKKGFADHIVTFLGRVTRQKGPEYFIQAAFKVLQKMDNVRFVMAGTGDLFENMIRYVAKLKISNKFHFTGFLKGDDVCRMYAMSDLYVMPSVSEPFGISSLEAIQNNVPVIISKQSGVSEVINNAIKVDYWDIDAIADAIYGVLNYNAIGNLMKNKSKQEASHLSWDRVAAKIKEIYYQVA